MSAQPRPRLTPVLWARILARYGELGRPLTDAELQGIVLPAAGSAAKCFAVTLPAASLRVEPSLRPRLVSDLTADELDSFESFTTTTTTTTDDDAKAQAHRGLTMSDKIAVVAGADVQADGMHVALHGVLAPQIGVICDPHCMIWDGALALVSAGMVGDLSEAVTQAIAAHKLLPARAESDDCRCMAAFAALPAASTAGNSTIEFVDLEVGELDSVEYDPEVAKSIVCGYVVGEFTMTAPLWKRIWALYKQLGRTLTEDELAGLVDAEAGCDDDR